MNRCIANNFVTEVEEARGPTTDAACNTKTKLVEAKLEMIRAAWLFHCSAPVSGVRWINSRDRLQPMKSTDVYKDALARGKADPAVTEALGSPIKDGFLVLGNTNVNGV